MATVARGPRVLKGALVSIASGSSSPSVIAFQYNPHSLKRSLKPLLVGGESGDRSQTVRIVGAPVETISVEIELDATDDLEQGDATALAMGLHPQLAALELLIFPASAHITALQSQLSSGTLEIAPMTAPRLLFVWGPRRVQPVQISSYSIAEEEFDTNLNPIRATVSLEMRVLTYSDLSSTTADYHQYLAYQQSLESMAPKAITSSTSGLGGITIQQAPPTSAAETVSEVVDFIGNIASSLL